MKSLSAAIFMFVTTVNPNMVVVQSLGTSILVEHVGLSLVPDWWSHRSGSTELLGQKRNPLSHRQWAATRWSGAYLLVTLLAWLHYEYFEFSSISFSLEAIQYNLSVWLVHLVTIHNLVTSLVKGIVGEREWVHVQDMEHLARMTAIRMW